MAISSEVWEPRCLPPLSLKGLSVGILFATSWVAFSFPTCSLHQLSVKCQSLPPLEIRQPGAEKQQARRCSFLLFCGRAHAHMFLGDGKPSCCCWVITTKAHAAAFPRFLYSRLIHLIPLLASPAENFTVSFDLVVCKISDEVPWPSHHCLSTLNDFVRKKRGKLKQGSSSPLPALSGFSLLLFLNFKLLFYWLYYHMTALVFKIIK